MSETNVPSATDIRGAESERSTAVGRIVVALVAAWVGLVAIPDAVPWAAKEDTARALADGVVIASIVALVGLALAFLHSDSTGDAGARIGVAAAVIAVILAGLEVANLMLLPADAPYRATATGIGLILLLVVSLVYLTGPQLGFFSGFKFSTLTFTGALAALILVGVYLLLLQSMSTRTGSATSDAEWIRLTSLLSGLQALAFAAAGALLGTAVQGQATNRAAADVSAADAANDELTNTVSDVASKAKSGELVQLAAPDAIPVVLDTALGLDPSTFDRHVNLRAMEVDRLHQTAIRPADDLTRQLERSLERARRLRRRS